MSQPEFDLCGCVYTNVGDAYQKTRVTVCTQLHHSSLEIHFLGIVNSNCITQARFLCANIHNSSNMYSATSVQYQIFADVRGTSAVKAVHIAPVETYMWNSKYEVANDFQATVLQKAMLSWIRSNEHNITNLVRIEQQLVLPYTEIVRLSTESKVFSNTMGLPFISRIHSDFIPRNKSRPVVTRLTCTFPVEVQQMRSLYLVPGSFKRSLLWQRECYGLKRYNSQRKRNRWYLSSHQIMKSFPQSPYTGHTQRDPPFYQRLHKKLDIHYRPTNKYNLLQVNMFNVSHPIENFFNNTDHCLSNSEFGTNHLEIPQLAVVRRADANTCGPSALQAVESEEGISKLTIYQASATGSRYVEKGARFLSLPHPGVEQSIKADVLSPECCRLDDASIFSFKGPFGGLLNQNQHSLIYAHSKFQTLPSGINIDHICHWSTVILHLALTISFEYSLLGFCGIFPNYAAKHQEIGLDDTSNSRGQLERRCNNLSQAVFHISYFGFLINSLPYCLTSLLYNLESRPQLYTSRKNSITIEEAVSVKASKTRHISVQGELKTCWISTTKLVTKQYYGCTVEIDLEDVSKLSSECLELNSCHTHFVESPNYRGSNERRATVLQDSKNTERILFKTEQGSCTPNVLDYSKQKGHGCVAKQRFGDSSEPINKNSELESHDSVFKASNTRRVVHTERGDPGLQEKSGPIELRKTQYSLSALTRSSRSHHTRLESSEDTSVSSEDQLEEKNALHKGITVGSLLRRYDRLTKELLKTKRSLHLLCQREKKRHENRLDSPAVGAEVSSTKDKSAEQENRSDAAVVYNYLEKLRRQSRVEAHPRNAQQCTTAIRQELNSPTLNNARQVPFYSTHYIRSPASDSGMQHSRQCSPFELYPVSQLPKDYAAPIYLPVYATEPPEPSKDDSPVNTYWTPRLNYSVTPETLYPSPYALLKWPTPVNGHKRKQLNPTQPDSYSRSILNRRAKRYLQANLAHRGRRPHSRHRSRSQCTMALEQPPRVSTAISPTCIPVSCCCTHSGIPGVNCCPSLAKSVPQCSAIYNCCNAGFHFRCAANSAEYHHNAKQGTQGPPENQWEKRTDPTACLVHQTQPLVFCPHTTLSDQVGPISSKCSVCPTSIQGSTDNNVPKIGREMSQTHWVSGRHCLSAYEPTVPTHICMPHAMTNHKRYSPPHGVSQVKELVHSNLAPMYGSEQHGHIEPSGQPWPRSPAMKTDASFSAQPTNRIVPPKQYPQEPSCKESDWRPDAITDQQPAATRWNTVQPNNQPTDMQQPTAKILIGQSGLYNQINTRNSKPPSNETHQMGQMSATRIPPIVANPMPRTANQSLKDIQLVNAENSAPPPALPERSMVAARAHLRADPVTAEDWKEVERRFDQLQRDRAALEAHFRRLSQNGLDGKIGVYSEDAQLRSSLVQLDEQLSALRLLLQRRHAENRRLTTGPK